MLRRSPVSLNAISHDCAMELVSEVPRLGLSLGLELPRAWVTILFRTPSTPPPQALTHQ